MHALSHYYHSFAPTEKSQPTTNFKAFQLASAVKRASNSHEKKINKKTTHRRQPRYEKVRKSR